MVAMSGVQKYKLFNKINKLQDFLGQGLSLVVFHKTHPPANFASNQMTDAKPVFFIKFTVTLQDWLSTKSLDLVTY